jgi:DNA-directed RNA polymerase subunit RPC12/RpoP
MDQREEKEIMYGCFRCGTQVEAPDDLIRPACCESCGSPYLITYQEALDLLNDLFLKKKFVPAVLAEDDGDTTIVDESNE